MEKEKACPEGLSKFEKEVYQKLSGNNPESVAKEISAVMRPEYEAEIASLKAALARREVDRDSSNRQLRSFMYPASIPDNMSDYFQRIGNTKKEISSINEEIDLIKASISNFEEILEEFKK